jgi:hypothetical protein
VYVWDLIGDAGRWDPDAAWAGLASSDAKAAFAAVRVLRANPGEAVGLLAERVKVPAVPSDETVAGLVKRLDAPGFAERERAPQELTAAAELIRPKLEAARKAASPEAGRRLGQVRTAADGWTPDRLRQVRACEVLEGVSSPAAARLLGAWAAGPAEARLTTEAKESLDRPRK